MGDEASSPLTTDFELLRTSYYAKFNCSLRQRNRPFARHSSIQIGDDRLERQLALEIDMAVKACIWGKGDGLSALDERGRSSGVINS